MVNAETKADLEFMVGRELDSREWSLVRQALRMIARGQRVEFVTEPTLLRGRMVSDRKAITPADLSRADYADTAVRQAVRAVAAKTRELNGDVVAAARSFTGADVAESAAEKARAAVAMAEAQEALAEAQKAVDLAEARKNITS